MERRFDLDLVRVCAFGVLVLYHVGMYYVTWDWHVNRVPASPALEPFMLLSSPWRLSLLFLVSGAATTFLLGKRPHNFLGVRSWRLLVPLIFGMLVIVPPQAYYELLDSRYPGGYRDGYLAFWGRYLLGDGTFCDDDGCLSLPTWNHLWFVAYLWCYTVAAWVLARLAPAALDHASRLAAHAMSGIGVLAIPIALLATARMLLVGRFESTHGLVDDWFNHAQYFGVFLLGMLLARSEAPWSAMQSLRWIALVMAALSYGFIAWYFFGAGFNEGRSPPDWLRTTQRILWAVNQWSMIVAIFGFAYRFRSVDIRALGYLTLAVFPIYILHQTVIVIASQWLKPLAIRPALEGPLLATITLAACFGAYELIRRIRWLRPLFGLGQMPAESYSTKSESKQWGGA
ncbi:acyltransferase family protein [Luteimonas sp. SJ-92]|uniref:Acyltransferase family protein n=1 Tax=Luteimonas salinisoli TaxID=2752307 RepID=A0A853JA65_9GAMM|nr:acyltransferase family protein [Luteimonas salinisoli]NZA25569.1 acyltransferase family protein [Luteimonas salinisoli]